MTEKVLSLSSKNGQRSSFDLSSLLFWKFYTPEEEEFRRTMQEHYIKEHYKNQFKSLDEDRFRLKDLVTLFEEGAQAIVKDDISECFEPNLENRWNWNYFLFVMWCIGVVFRHIILFPLRLSVLVIGSILFYSLFALISVLKLSNSRKANLYRSASKFYSGVFTFTWFGIIKSHGTIPPHKPNQIYVANHSSMIDYIILLTEAPFVVLAQSYNGWIGLMQKMLEKLVGGVWFDRKQEDDRRRCIDIIKEYIKCNDGKKNRLLIFPEGTCVNTKYCIQFKKGAFELGAEICPIAIKYNESFTDAYWNSRKKSFLRHLYDLMTSWALVVDIYYLKPQRRLSNETSQEFAERVKNLICDAGGLQSKEWSGYLKHIRPSPRFKQYRQRIFAEKLKKKGPSVEDSEEVQKNGKLRRRYSASTIENLTRGINGSITSEEKPFLHQRKITDSCNEEDKNDKQMKNFFKSIGKRSSDIPLNGSNYEK